MALVGTVSGSNGTSTTAISGSLIIANRPSGLFPNLPSGVNLYVSGARGVDVDSASALFGGDVFMSGALGLQEYLQLRPINNKRFPTATTASYIYTSGSTNDLYFTQFSGSYQNNVRLRWLEGTLTTGLLNGGIVSTVAGTTTFSVTAGAGIIVSQNAAITSDPYPTIEYVSWPAIVSASLLYSGSAQITYVSIESGGTTAQSNTAPTLAQYKDRIFLGRVLHQTGSVSNGAINSPAMAYAVSSNTFDFIRPFGPLKVSGHVLTTSGSTLGLLKTAGDSYSEGRNYSTDLSAPNTILAAADPELTNCKIYRQYVSGSTIIQDTGVALAGYAVIDPSKYNNNGTLAAVGNSEWTNQRVFWFPKSVNRALYVYYGNAKYNTLLEATAGLITENFVEADNTKGAAIYIGAVSVKGNGADLTDTVNARLTQAGLFRGAGTGGGSSGGTTSPGGSTTQVQFNDGGAFGGDPNFTFNNITHALSVTGDITGSNLRLTGDIAVIGGDLTTTVSAFNLVDTSATTVNFARAATSLVAGSSGGSTTFQGNVTGSRVTSIATGDLTTGGGQIYLNGASSNRIDFSTQGTGDPAFNAPTAGTKIVLYPAAGASATDYALGISPATLWQSLPQADPSMMFKWYGGTTMLAALSGSGNMEIAGDLAVNGGDITTTAGTFNLVNATATTLNIGGAATTVAIGAASGRTTIANDLAITTGNIIGAPGSGANVMSLISSGNIVAKLDINNDATGHKFIVQDYAGASQFSVGENGNADLTGSFAVTGSITALAGFSGSLTKLADGSNYLIAGSGVTLTTGSNGSVTITYPAGSNVTSSFTNASTWAFTHGMNKQFVIIQTYDTSFNQIIPQNITLTDSNTATITFPTPESGYAVASIGGVGAYVSSSSYALTASYVNTLNQFVQVTGSVSMNGDLAVNGGDITSTAGTFNIAGLTNVTNLYGSNLLIGATSNVNLSGSSVIANAGVGGLSFQRDGSTYATLTGDTTSVSIGSTPSRTTANFFNGNVTTLNIASAGTSINIGSGAGRTTVSNDLVVGTGNILVTNDGTPITLISSGNILAKLDINNNGTGHQFQVQDYLGTNQFTVGENGAAEVSGSLLVSGTTNMGPVTERLINSNGSTGIVTFDLTLQGIFYVNAPAADITANFTTTPTTNLRVVTPTVILSQSSTARIVSGCQIDGAWQTINWANGVTPTGTAGKQDVFGFSLIRSGSAWKVLGQLSTYG